MKQIVSILFVVGSLLLVSTAQARGCGSHGGPGWRKADGQCASWKDGAKPSQHKRKHK